MYFITWLYVHIWQPCRHAHSTLMNCLFKQNILTKQLDTKEFFYETNQNERRRWQCGAVIKKKRERKKEG